MVVASLMSLQCPMNPINFLLFPILCLVTMYTPQANISQWFSTSERLQVPKSPSFLLQSIRDGTFIWRVLTLHVADPPPISTSITERWRQIASALLDCGVELTAYGLKLILLGDSDTIDKLFNVLFSLHHAGGQGTSAVASLITPCVPEPEVMYPKLFHSALVNARQNNFVDRVKMLTDACCTADSTNDDRELMQLEALASHSSRLVEYGLTSEFFNLAVQQMARRCSQQASLKAASLLKSFVSQAGPEASLRCMLGRSDDSEPNNCFSVLDEFGVILRSTDALPELQDFLRLLLASVSAAYDNSPSTSLKDVGVIDNRHGTLKTLLCRLFPCSTDHKAVLEHLWIFTTRVEERLLIKQLAPWLCTVSVALLEGRDPEHETFSRFNPNGRFEDNFLEEVGLDGELHSAAKAQMNEEAVQKKTFLLRDEDDDVEADVAAKSAKRAAEVRVSLQRAQAKEKKERDVCALALRLCLRLWSEFPEISSASDLVFDVNEFLKTSRGLELSQRPEVLCELSCAIFAHPLLYAHTMRVLDTVKSLPELRRMIMQNLSDFHDQPRVTGGSLGVETLSVDSSLQTNSRTVQLLEWISCLDNMLPNVSGLGDAEGTTLLVAAKSLVQELALTTSSSTMSRQGTSSSVSPHHFGTHSSLDPSENERVHLPISPTSGNSSLSVSMKTVAQFVDLLVTLIDKDPFFQRHCVVAFCKLSSYFFSLSLDPLRMEFMNLLTTTINELLTLAERHVFTDSILQAVAQIFLEHGAEGRRAVAECVHMFFQTLVRRDLNSVTAADAALNDAFVKRFRRLCEVTGMPTTRVKVKVLDEEEAARLAAARRAEEEERKRVAAEEAEKVRRELEDQYARESGHDRRKKYVRKPLYVAPERPGEFGRGSVFEYKRNFHWIQSTVVLGTIMDKVAQALSKIEYEKRVIEPKKKPTAQQISESFWSGWQKGKTYEQRQQEKREHEQAELERREILRRIRDHDVKEKLKQESLTADMKKLQRLFAEERHHFQEEENDCRLVIRNASLKSFVNLYHMFQDERSILCATQVSVSRQRAAELHARQEEERQRVRDKVTKYWEEKEYLEAQLLRHRREEAERAEREEEQRKRQYLEEQKRRLMTWRLQNQYEISGVPPDGADSSASTTISSAAQQVAPLSLTAKRHDKKPEKQQQEDKIRSSGHLSPTKAGPSTKLAPLLERKASGRAQEDGISEQTDSQVIEQQ